MCFGISLCRGLQSLFSHFILFSSHGSLSREWISKESLRFQRDLDVLFSWERTWQLLVWWSADCPLAFWLQVLLPSRAVNDSLPCATWFSWVSIKDAIAGLQLFQRSFVNYSHKWKAEPCVIDQPAIRQNERHISHLLVTWWQQLTEELWAPCLGAEIMASACENLVSSQVILCCWMWAWPWPEVLRHWYRCDPTTGEECTQHLCLLLLGLITSLVTKRG